MTTLSPQDAVSRSRHRIALFERLAKDKSLSPEKRRSARALLKSAKLALKLRVRSNAHKVLHKLMPLG